MKKVFYSITTLLLSLSLFSSCDKLKDMAKVNFNLENGDATFTMPVITTTGEMTINASNIYINLDSMIKAQNSDLGADNIKEVRIKSCEMTLNNGDEKNNFSAIENCKIELSSNINTDNIEIASVTNNPDVAAQILPLNVNESLDLKAYFMNATEFSYRMSVKTRKTTDKELDCKIIVKYTIVAGL